MAMVERFDRSLQVAGRLHHLVPPVLADADEVRVVDLLARLDVLAVGPLQVAFDGVVLEVDDGLLLVLDLRAAAATVSWASARTSGTAITSVSE